MPIPLLVLVGTALLGWGAGKVAESSGNKLRREANDLVRSTKRYATSKKEEYHNVRRAAKSVVRRFAAEIKKEIPSGTTSLPVRQGKMPKKVKLAFERIMNAEIVRLGGARFSWEIDLQGNPTGRGIAQQAHVQSRSGHPNAAAALWAVAAASRGIEHHAASKNYLNSAKASDEQSRRDSDALLASAQLELADIKKDIGMLRKEFRKAKETMTNEAKAYWGQIADIMRSHGTRRLDAE